MNAIKKSVSMAASLWERAEERFESLGYSTMSAYLQALVREDLIRRGHHLRVDDPKDRASKVSSVGEAFGAVTQAALNEISPPAEAKPPPSQKGKPTAPVVYRKARSKRAPKHPTYKPASLSSPQSK